MRRLRVPAALAALALAGCGSSGGSTSSATPPATTRTASATPPPVTPAILAAEQPDLRRFPRPQGRSLQQLAKLVHASAQLGAATGTFTPGTRRFAFGLNLTSGAFLYAPTVVYIARSPSSHDVAGPFPAPADPMTVAPAYRSRQNSGPGGIKAIYAAEVPVSHTGTFTVLALTQSPQGLVGAPGEIAVAARSPIPDVGQRPPAIATDTLASVHSNLGLLTTRVPPEQMHSASLAAVLGKRPVALLFSTPQLCTSRVCGPVTDVTVSLQSQFASRMAFIHQEVYVNNQPSRGLRPQMKAFGLQTEPWLFTINRRGIIAARLEGAFGVNEVRAALEAALR